MTERDLHVFKAGTQERGVPDRVESFEVRPRDGLQTEARLIPVAEKVALVDCLSGAGIGRIECAGFVSPKRLPGVSCVALTPNLRGLDATMAAKADGAAIFGSASDGFSRVDINASIAERLERFAPVSEAAQAADLPVRGQTGRVTRAHVDHAIDARTQRWTSEEAREGVAAFFDKRSPSWPRSSRLHIFTHRPAWPSSSSRLL